MYSYESSLASSSCSSSYLDARDQSLQQHTVQQAPSVRDLLDVFWSLGNKYYSIRVDSVTADGNLHLLCDNGDKEELNLNSGSWRFYFPPAVTSPKCKSQLQDPVVVMSKHF